MISFPLWFYNGGFYLISRCRWKKDVRIFAVERIKAFDPTEKFFNVPVDFNSEDFMRHSLGVFRGKPEKIHIWFDADVSDYVKEKVWHDSQEIRDPADDFIVFREDVAVNHGTQALDYALGYSGGGSGT